MTIREYNPEDFDHLMNLLQLNTPEYFAPEEEADFIEYLSDKRDLYFVAEEDNKIMGCGGLNRSDEGKTVFISWDIIHPEHQKKGIGNKLTRHRFEVVKTIPGIEKIVVRTSQYTFKFYKKMGFTLTETVKDYWATGFDLYYMEMPLQL